MIIWIASYPRSGNTFLRVILKHAFNIETYSIYDDKRDIAADTRLANAVGHRFLPPDFDIEEARNSDELFVIKTHDYPENEKDKAIYLIRDGRECLVSYWHYLRSYVGESFSLKDVLYGNVPFGLWADHVERWDPRCRANTFVIKFEELTSDPGSHLPSLTAFIEKHVARNALPSFEELQGINPRFFRKGKVDSWKQELSADDEFTFWLLNLEEMQEFYPNQEAPTELNSETARTIMLFLRPYGRQLRTDYNELLHELSRTRAALSATEVSLTTQLKMVKGLREKSRAIREAKKQLTDVKAVWAPRIKVRKYKQLLDAIDAPIPKIHDEL